MTKHTVNIFLQATADTWQAAKPRLQHSCCRRLRYPDGAPASSAACGLAAVFSIDFHGGINSRLKDGP